LQPYADHVPVFADSVDAISVQLQFGDDDGWEVDPTGAQFGEWDWSASGLAELIEESPLLAVSDLHRLDLTRRSSSFDGVGQVRTDAARDLLKLLAPP
jgi:hypothetical protein